MAEVHVTIGGKAYTLPPLTFAQLKRVTPLMAEAQLDTPPQRLTEIAIGVLAMLIGELSAAVIEEALLVSEIDGLFASYTDFLRANGLIPPKAPIPGEASATGSVSIGSTT